MMWMKLLTSRWTLAGVVLIALSSGVLYYGHTQRVKGEAAGRAEVQARWDHSEAEKAAESARLAATARAKEDADKQSAKRIQDALQQKLDFADSRARDLARRLSAYQARSGQPSLPQAPGSAPVADPPAGVSPGSGAVEQAAESAFGACARDAERLAGWQEWWGAVSND